MKQIIASVYDSQVQVWSFPQAFINKGHLARSWADAANDPQCPFSKYPGHFTMFIVGEWDDSTGQIQMYQAPESLGTALQYKNAPVQSLREVADDAQPAQ